MSILSLYFSKEDQWLLEWLRETYPHGKLSSVGRDLFYNFWEKETRGEAASPSAEPDPAGLQTSPATEASQMQSSTNTAETHYRLLFGDIENDSEFITMIGGTQKAVTAVQHRMQTLHTKCANAADEAAVLSIFKDRHKRLAEMAGVIL